MHLSSSALLAISACYALGVKIEPRATTLPAPISFAPDENWDGIDGQWSTFTLRVGTPEQVVRTLISFQSYQTWVIGPQGCQTAGDVGACTQQRGGSYNNQTSSTADYIGIYGLGVDEDLGLVSNAIFVYDTLGLGLDGERGPTLKNTTVGQMAADAFYLGMFGLDPKPTNFTTLSDGSPSYMTLLKQQGQIPSISAGYTAGAQYRFTGELASLTLGGYDSAKFVPNDVEFDFAADNEKFLMVGLQSITTPASVPSSPVATELLPGPIYALLDTTVAEIWLPLEACKAFEEVFGIEYDNATELYLVNQTLHDTLKAANPTINFTLGQDLTAGPTLQIGLPYSAFDLTAKSPYQALSTESYYFPLRRGANDTQYTIGRTFFQEAYLTINWESQRFNVSQRIWNDTSSESIVTIPPSNGTTAAYINPSISNTDGKQGLGEGAIAGIAVGGFAIIVLFVLFLWIWHCRRKAACARAEDEKLGHIDHDDSTPTRGAQATVFPKAELEASSPGSTRSPRRIRDVDSCNHLAAGTSPTSGSPTNAGWPANGRDSPSIPARGMGIHTSTQSSSQIGTSILDPGSFSNTSEADSRERPVYEMAADFLPTVKEKDGKALSEKEAMMRREKIYNGVEQKVLIRHPPPAASAPLREVGGRVSPRTSSMSGVSLAGPAGRPASRVSSNGERRSISGLELTSPASRTSLNGGSRKDFNGTAAQDWMSPSAGRRSIERVALHSNWPTGARRVASETGLSSPVSPVTLVSPVIKERRSVDGSTLESPVSPIAAGRSKMGDRAFLSVHRAFPFER